MKIVAIDVGILHLGLVCAEVTWENTNVEDVHLVDLTKRCRNPQCNLGHTNHMVDRVDHFIYNYKQVLDKADKILIEKQPIQGLLSVEQLLFDRLRARVIFIHPLTMHKHFSIGKLSYDERKDFLVEETRPFLEGTIFDQVERKHDLADAMAMIIYWRKSSGPKVHRELGKPGTPFDKFRYVPGT